MKTKKRFLSILLSLALVLGLMPGVSLTAYAADTTVTWNASDIVTVNPWDKSFTKDGITFAPGYADFLDKNFTNGGTFTTASGKFTKIEVTAPYVDISGTGWSGGTWTGDASSSVSYSGDIYDLGMGQLKIVFTIAPDAVAVTGVSLNKESTTLTVGGTETLTATVAPDNATDKTVTWTSSNTSVATVSNAGLVTAVAAGTATITVTATNGTADDTSDDKTATCAVTVNASGTGGGSSDYTLVIPSALTVSASGWNATDGISATGTLESGKKLTVTATSANSWALKQQDGSETVSYTMKETSDGEAKTAWEFTTLPGSATLGIDVADYSGKPAGTYQDTVTFTASVADAVPEYYNKMTKIDDSYDDQVYLLKQLGRGRQAYNSSLTAAQAYALATYQAAIDGKAVYVIMSSKEEGYEIHYAVSTDAAATEHTSDLYDICNESNPVRMYYIAQ